MNESPELPTLPSHHSTNVPQNYPPAYAPDPSIGPMSSTCSHLSKFFDNQFIHVVQTAKHNPNNPITLPAQLMDLQTIFAYYMHIRKAMSKRPANRFVPQPSHQPVSQPNNPSTSSPSNVPSSQSINQSLNQSPSPPALPSQSTPSSSPTSIQSNNQSNNSPSPMLPSNVSSKPRCATCNRSSVRLVLCIGCQYIACVGPYQSGSQSNSQTTNQSSNHARKHADERGHWCWLEIGLGEELSLYQSTNQSVHPSVHQSINQSINDSTVGQIFCTICNDYVYHAGILWLATIGGLVDHRKRLTNDLFDFSPEDQSLIKQHSTSSHLVNQANNPSNNQPVNELLQGIRGIVNLGQTCYLSVVIQSIVQNPFMRNYFLSDLHNADRCMINRTINQVSSQSRVCLACDFDDMFNQFYSFNQSNNQSNTQSMSQGLPYVPNRLLTSLWCRAEHLMGAGQHDAHECLIALIDQLHVCLSSQLSNHPTNGPCPCLAHMVYGGELRSEVQCSTCGGISTSIEPVFDYSVDWQTIKQSINQSISSPDEPITPTLTACLSRFTSPETIERFQCTRCSNNQTINPASPSPSVSPPLEGSAIKKLSFQSLPLCLIVHFKRFEQTIHQSKSGKTSVSSVKNDEYVEFPLSHLDLAPYLYSGISPRDVAAQQANQSNAPPISHSKDCMYHCYCVIVHKGSLETGHYWCYFRRDMTWYKMDDKLVTRVSTQEVQNAKAYLLFYTKCDITRFG